MGSSTNRRNFLGILLGGAPAFAFSFGGARPAFGFGAAGFSMQSPAFAAQAASITATPLSDNLIHFTGAGGPGENVNVVVLAGPDGLVMVNGGREEVSANLLKAVAEQTGGKRVDALFNTDWHREHTGSNEAVRKAGATIIAHEHTKQYLGAEIYVDWQNRTYKPLPKQALPNQTFYTSGALKSIDTGAERIEYGHLGQAHTDAAIYVFFPQANVLVAGGALSVGKYPIPDYTTGGWLGGLIAANKTLLGLAKPDTRIVPAAGPIQTRADLQAQHDMLAALFDRIGRLMKQGMGPEDIIAAATTKEYDAKWGNPELFVSAACRSMWLHVRELGGIV
jgi:glyoxylase-like metal-dependent hydrolase (beta-lactamase superfamily II)